MKSPVVHPLRIAACMVLAAIVAVFVLGVLVGVASAQSGRHGDGHAEQHDIYRNWRIPFTGNSCCNDSDCRPTRAYVDEEAGVWRAWNGTRWLFIPPGLVLPTDHAGDGRSHLCEKDGNVYCFTPGQIRG